MEFISGRLYRTLKSILLSPTEQLVWHDTLPEIDTKIDTITTVSTKRKLKASWSYQAVQDFRLHFDKIHNHCRVPSDDVVMYVETGKTGSYKFLYGEFIGWTSDTLNSFTELEEVQNAESKDQA